MGNENSNNPNEPGLPGSIHVEIPKYQQITDFNQLCIWIEKALRSTDSFAIRTDNRQNLQTYYSDKIGNQNGIRCTPTEISCDKIDCNQKEFTLKTSQSMPQDAQQALVNPGASFLIIIDAGNDMWILPKSESDNQGHPDLLNQLGIAFFRDGSTFVGSFGNDIKLKRGTLTYINGDQYEGDFNNNLPESENGKFTLKNGLVYIGVVTKGEMNQKGTLRFIGENNQFIEKESLFIDGLLTQLN